MKHLSRAEICDRISYPSMKKKSLKLEPLSCELSRRVLDEYHSLKYRSGISLSMVSTRLSDRATYRRGVSDSQEFCLNTASNAQLNERLTEILEHIATGGDLDPQNYLVAGDILVCKGRFLDAVEYYTSCLKLDPMITECYLKKGRAYRSLHEITEGTMYALAALDEYKKYMQLEKGTKEILVQSGKCALDAGLLDEAELLFNQCLEMTSDDNDETLNGKCNANDSYAHYNLGEVAERRCIGREEDTEYIQSCMAKAKFNYKHVGTCFALPYYEQAIEEILINRNNTLALRLLEGVAKMVPNDPVVHLWLAEVYTNLGPEFTSCVLSALTKAIELPQFQLNTEDDKCSFTHDYLVKCPPHHQATLLKRSLVYLDVLSDTEKAIQDLTLCLSLPDHLPTDDERSGYIAIIIDNHNVIEKALVARARAFERRGGSLSRKAAMDDYQRFVAIPYVDIREKGYPYYFLAQGFEAEGKYEKAGRYYALSVVAGYGQLPSLPSDNTTETNDVFVERGQCITTQNDGIVRKRALYQCVFSAVIQQELNAANIVLSVQQGVHKNSMIPEVSATDTGGVTIMGGKKGTQGTHTFPLPSQLPGYVYNCRGWMTHKNTEQALAYTAVPMTVLTLVAGVHGGDTNDSIILGKDKSECARMSAPVGSAVQHLADQWIRKIKAREPTVHRSDEIRTLKNIISHMQRLEKVKEEHECARLGKGKKKR